MKNIALTALACVVFGFPLLSEARDELLNVPIADALSAPDAATRLKLDQIAFRFGDEPHSEVEKHLGEYSTNKRTRALGRSASEACHRVFLTAMLELQKRAESLGANGVVNIRSNWRNQQTSSSTTYVCAKGGVMAGVALIGEFVVLGGGDSKGSR